MTKGLHPTRLRLLRVLLGAGLVAVALDTPRVAAASDVWGGFIQTIFAPFALARDYTFRTHDKCGSPFDAFADSTKGGDQALAVCTETDPSDGVAYMQGRLMQHPR